jgi:aminoglycoside phosphotransferase (APT) family kinase protein
MTLADRLLLYMTSRSPEATISNFNFLARGFESEIYTFQLQSPHSPPKDHILRLFTGEGATGKLAREAKALSLLSSSGYPVPALLCQETDSQILGNPFEIISRLEGKPLWHILAGAKPDRQSQLLARFGSLLAQLHQMDWRSSATTPGAYGKNPAFLLEEIISQYRSLYTKYNVEGFLRLVDWLDTRKQEIGVQPALVHQDFHANNVLLCSDERLFVIDWTQFAVSDRRMDLAWTLLIMGDLGNMDWKNQILAAYAAHSNEPIQHLEYFHAIVSMKLLGSTVISFLFSPEELGLQPATVKLTKEQLSIYRLLARQLRELTGVPLPELEDVLETI